MNQSQMKAVKAFPKIFNPSEVATTVVSLSEETW